MTDRDMDDAQLDFSRRFGQMWQISGGSALEGRIAGYLLVDESGGVTAAELSARLSMSTGSVSTATRRLLSGGFIRKLRRPGSRADHFLMDSDVWAGFLAQETRYLRAQRDLAASALRTMAEGSDAHARVQNMHDYMSWLLEDVDLPRAWEAHNRELAQRRRRAPRPGLPPTHTVAGYAQLVAVQLDAGLGADGQGPHPVPLIE